MELDDLRRTWKQPSAAETPTGLDATQLQKLLKSQPGLVEKMRRNARWELALTVLVALGLPYFIATASSTLYRLYGGAMLLLAIGMLYYYYRKLVMLRHMAQSDGNVRKYLQTLCVGLRNMLRFYYKLTLATGPYMLLMVLGYYVGREAARPGDFRWKMLAIIAGVLLVFGAILQVGVVYGTRWYLQRLYGQHLDRLETLLQELEE